jgi:hypothetical protein
VVAQAPTDPSAVQWSLLAVPIEPSRSLSATKQIWLRCAVRFPEGTLEEVATLHAEGSVAGAWLNGKLLKSTKAEDNSLRFAIANEDMFGNDDPNVLVLCFDVAFDASITTVPKVVVGNRETELKGIWQAAYVNLDSKIDNLALTNIPLPAKFALPPAVFYECHR